MFIVQKNLIGYVSEELKKENDLYSYKVVTDVFFNEETDEPELCYEEIVIPILENTYFQEEPPTNIILRFSAKDYIAYFERDIDDLEEFGYSVFNKRLEDLNKEYFYQIAINKDNTITSKQINKNELPNECYMVDCSCRVPYRANEIRSNSLVFAIDIPEINHSRDFHESIFKEIRLDEIKIFDYKR